MILFQCSDMLCIVCMLSNDNNNCFESTKTHFQPSKHWNTINIHCHRLKGNITSISFKCVTFNISHFVVCYSWFMMSENAQKCKRKIEGCAARGWSRRWGSAEDFKSSTHLLEQSNEKLHILSISGKCAKYVQDGKEHTLNHVRGRARASHMKNQVNPLKKNYI